MRPNITHAISVISQYMHDQRKKCMQEIYQILPYLKLKPKKGVTVKERRHFDHEDLY